MYYSPMKDKIHIPDLCIGIIIHTRACACAVTQIQISLMQVFWIPKLWLSIFGRRRKEFCAVTTAPSVSKHYCKTASSKIRRYSPSKILCRSVANDSVVLSLLMENNATETLQTRSSVVVILVNSNYAFESYNSLLGWLSSWVGSTQRYPLE